jgi:uncharacterized protein YcnI
MSLISRAMPRSKSRNPRQPRRAATLALSGLAAAAMISSAGAASAHVSVTPAQAPAGSYQVLRFGVGHGCDGQASTALSIQIPPGVKVARPQPKPGWTLSADWPKGETERPAAITWTGELPANQFDEFLILVRLPAEAGALAFPAIQTCGGAQNRWVETPQPGGARPEHPAPTVLVTPAAAPDGGHHHHER